MTLENDDGRMLTPDETDNSLLWGIGYRKLRSGWESTGQEIPKKKNGEI